MLKEYKLKYTGVPLLLRKNPKKSLKQMFNLKFSSLGVFAHQIEAAMLKATLGHEHRLEIQQRRNVELSWLIQFWPQTKLDFGLHRFGDPNQMDRKKLNAFETPKI